MGKGLTRDQIKKYYHETWCSPYNNRFNLNARGCHVARLRERRASSLSPFCFAGGASAVLSG
jgi:hypothetical protein